MKGRGHVSGEKMGPSIDVRLKRAYWHFTTLALAAYFGGWGAGLDVAIAVTAGQAIHFGAEQRSLCSLEVQVRAAYLGLLLIGLVPSLGFIHVAQFVGLIARMIFEYCPLARMLALAPWNRTVPLSWSLVRWLVFSPPAPGSILDRLPRGVRAAEHRRTCAT